MSSLNPILVPLADELKELEKVMHELLDSEVPFVRSVAEYVIDNGGKRLRPILTILCAKLAGFSGREVYEMGTCLEFIHTASLLHDDVVDHATVRRGRASANAKWGNHVSVLVGDFFYCRASQLLTSQRNWDILKVVTDAIMTLTEGEVLEITKSMDFETSKDAYLKIIENKTAVLFAAACQVGAILGNLSKDKQKAMADYGHHLGMSFQLSDDVLDYTSQDEVLGKQSGIDLQEGKITLPVIMALEKATEKERGLIKDAMVAPKIEAGVLAEIKQVIEKYHGFQATLDLAAEHVEKAKQSLEAFRPSMERDMLEQIADFVIARQS
jgi:octaprenyl-diphosphate synthase